MLTGQNNPRSFCGAAWSNVSCVSFDCPAKGQPRKVFWGFSLVPAVIHTSARANLGRVEEKSSRYAKARVQIPNNPAGWLNTQAWGLAVASMGIRYIRGDAEDLPLPAFGVGGGFKVKISRGGVMAVVPIRQEETEIVVTFDDFWSLYPRRVAKKDARRAWDRISPRFHPAILTALFEWARIWNARGEPEFIPHPATWLNGERWEDDFPPGHRPYSPPTAAQQIQEKQQEQGERKAMPAHVLDAIRKIRQV